MSTPAAPEKKFNEFYKEVKDIEKRDSVLTPKQQIDRLLRPGSTYFNLNPFEVLQIDPELPLDEVKKKYRRLSFLVHPDKNQDDAERAQLAFEAVNKAYKTLEDDGMRRKCMEVIEEAKGRTDMNAKSAKQAEPLNELEKKISDLLVTVTPHPSLNYSKGVIFNSEITERKKKLKKEGKEQKVEEDDPAKYKHAVYVLTMKLFADLERKRRDLEQRDMEERKRKREEEIEVEETSKTQKEWQKVYEESRQERVDSWKTFQAKGSKGAKKVKGFKPPKHKMETR